ncbi:MAG: lysylphosphatidylglycerol synthase transmembrane domain-containing protein [Candidatus Diapherotrites archaeon]|nr:lysylphosphatidylglycerol synthase transmembrane domain-containing protein [Candidatus Diapherotrites archaeon]
MNYKLLAKGILSLLIIWTLLQFVNIEKTISLVLTANPFFLFISMLLITIQITLSALNIWILMENRPSISFRKLLKYYCFGWVAGLTSIGKIGEFSTAYYLKKDGLPYTKTVAVIFLDKFITLVLFSVVSIVGTLWFFGFNNIPLLFFCTALFFGACIFLIFFRTVTLTQVPLVGKIRFVKNFITKNEAHFVEFRNTFMDYFSAHKNLLAKNGAITILKLIVMSINGSILFLALNNSINPLYMGFIIAIAAIVALAPVTLSGLGIVEATYIYLALLVSIQPETALATELLTLALNYSWAVIIIGFWLFFHKQAK